MSGIPIGKIFAIDAVPSGKIEFRDCRRGSASGRQLPRWETAFLA
ncbi:MAG TPA: hypothetical protein V6C98_14170 [Thermosynechococcaceae cyanobacterium]